MLTTCWVLKQLPGLEITIFICYTSGWSRAAISDGENVSRSIGDMSLSTKNLRFTRNWKGWIQSHMLGNEGLTILVKYYNNRGTLR